MEEAHLTPTSSHRGHKSAAALLAHPGTQYSAQLARQLHRRNCLHRFWTGFALPDNSRTEKLIRTALPRAPKWLANRVIHGIPADKIRTKPILEISAVLQMRFGGEPQIVMHDRNQKFQRAIPQSDIEESRVVIGFDTSSDILAGRAAAIGRPFVLDQTIAHPRSKQRVYQQIRQQFPDWSEDLDVRPPRISEGEEAEHNNAHRIVAASSFTRSTLIENGVPPEKVALNPYGVDLQRFAADRQPGLNRPFRFVFAGLVCARKGIPLLLQAWHALDKKDAELWIVGPVTPVAVRQLTNDNSIKLVGKVPNPELARIMASSDVFVFPSYFEGFGLVLLEAMAAGLPVLTTTATAGPDIVTERTDGFVIKPGDVDALINRMEFCLKNRDQARALGINARRTAERFTWDAFGDRWQEILEAVV